MRFQLLFRGISLPNLLQCFVVFWLCFKMLQGSSSSSSNWEHSQTEIDPFEPGQWRSVITLELGPCVLFRLCYGLFFFCLIVLSLYRVFVSCLVSYVLIFPCPHVSSKRLLCSSLCLSSMHSPHYLTCRSTSPVRRLVISVCVFSLCVPFTPCLVIVFVSLCLRPCSHSCVCSCSCSLCPLGMCSLDLDFWFSDVRVELCLAF